MKKLIQLLLLNVLFTFAFSLNVTAQTFDVNDIHEGQLLHAGDIIEFSSVYHNSKYHRDSNGDFRGYEVIHFVVITGDFCAIGNSRGFGEFGNGTIRSGESYTLPRDLYWYGQGDSDTRTLGFTLRDLWVEINSEYRRDGIERIAATVSGGTAPYTYFWCVGSRTGTPYDEAGNPTDSFVRPTDFGMSRIVTNTPYLDVNYSDISRVYGCHVVDSSNAYIAECKGGSSRRYIDIEGDASGNTNNGNDNQDNSETENSGDKPQYETPQTPSTVPNGTAQVSIGSDNKEYANVKVLNQYLHDSLNQKIIADLYAANHKKKANVLIQKNIFPPYGVKNDWKVSSHTIKWNNLNVKKGDTIIIVWYTPTFWGHTSTLKVIPATVVADGVIVFTIPAMGDMSVMSIVKLK